MPSKSNDLKSGILPDSPSRMVASPEFQQKCKDIREQILSDFELDIQRASFVKRYWLKWQAERLINSEIKKISPSEFAI